MDYLIKKSDQSIVQKWNDTVKKIKLPEQTVGVSQNNHTNASTSWTGLTKDFGIAPDPNYSGAHVASAAAAQSGLTISAQKSGGGTHQSRFCLASYGPA
jgi:hypothetical protein|tara:strand:- start:69 stop:365 length:297 start_codon:yes stop_codon:yes gene_type:complete